MQQVVYFLNLEFAVQAYLLNSVHPASIVDTNDTWLQYLTIGGDIKYYFNKNRLVRAISFFNPHLFMGASMNIRYTHTNCSSLPTILDPIKGVGARAGGGLEVNLSERFYIGLQGDYLFVSFPDEATEIIACETNTNKKISGDIVNVLFTAGINF